MDSSGTSRNRHQSAPVSISDKVKSVKGTIVTILKDTVWPSQSNGAAQDLLRLINSSPTLKNIPSDDTHIQTQDRGSLERLLRRLEGVRDKLNSASDKYGEKERELGAVVQHFFASLKPSKCTEVLKSCRSEVQNALASLPDRWNHGSVAETDAREILPTFHTEAPIGLVKSSASADVQPDRLTSPPPQPQSPIPVGLPVEKDEPITIYDKDKGISQRPDWLGIVKKTFNAVQTVSGTIPIVGSYVGAAANVGAMIIELIQNADGNEEAAKQLGSSAYQLSEILKNFENRSIEKRKDDLTKHISSLQGVIQRVQRQMEGMNSSGALEKAFFSSERGETLKRYQETIRAALEQAQLLVGLNTASLVAELYDKEALKEQRRLLNLLGDANYGARGDAIEDVVCLPGTRVQVLEHINAWIRATPAQGRVLWIRGMAGRGKSTIASSIAHQWKYQAACAIFHFRRGQSMLHQRLICALARQLGRSSLVPQVKEAILRSIEQNEDIAQERLQEQFWRLLVMPFLQSSSKDYSRPILLIVDALDECDDLEYAVNFVKLLDGISTSLPCNIKFLLTSRPEAALLRALEPRQWTIEDLDSMADRDSDVAQFLQHGFSRVRGEYNLGEDWPHPDHLRTLANMSQGLFQWAHTVIQYLMEGSPQLRLQELLASPSICDGLDDLYLQILSKAYKKAKKSPAREGLFVRMLGILVAAPHPISLDILAFLFADQPSFRNQTRESIVQLLRLEVFADLRSLIHLPNSATDQIQLVHTSVRDLLISKERCREEPYSVDLASNHHDLTLKCLQLMERDLKTNICNLSDLSKANSDPDIQELVQLHVPKGLQYCCRSWSFHLTAGSPELTLGDGGAIQADFKRFGEEKLLGWLEVMSLIGATREAIAIAKQVDLWLQMLSKESNRPFRPLWNDMHRFVTAFHEPISFGALHIYASALPSCPLKTALWTTYCSDATTRALNGPRDLTWSWNLWTKRTFVPVFAVAFSPDGKALASTGHGMLKIPWHTAVRGGDSNLDAIRLWDAETGAPIGEPLRGHAKAVRTIAFSPNGEIIVSGSEDETVRRWNSETGARIGEPMKGHVGTVFTVAFSPDGELLASGGEDKAIRLWDAKTGAVRQTLEGHNGAVRSVAFSPDGRILISGSDDKTIRRWDLKTGAPVGEPLNGHAGAVLAVTFSPDGRLLASGSEDETIQLWNAKDRTPMREPLIGHSGSVTAVAFSPSGSFLASGSGDSTIRLWDVGSGISIWELADGHHGSVNCVAFSRQGDLLASGSQDATIRLWDTQAGALIWDPLESGAASVGVGVLSAQGNSPSLASDDKTVPLWVSETGTPVGVPLKGHDSSVTAVAFSRDGTLLASGSSDKTIRLWDAKTGVPIGGPLWGHKGGIATVTFSPNGKLLASGSKDRTVRLWDAETRAALRRPLVGHGDSVNAVVFSPSGKILASGSGDQTIQLWDTETGAPLGEPLRGHVGRVVTVDFSPDGRLIASGSGDAIRVWDCETMALLSQHPTPKVQNIVFLPDSRLIVHYRNGSTTLFDSPRLQISDGGATMGHHTINHFLLSSRELILAPEGQWTTFLSKRLFWLPANYWDNKPHASGDKPLPPDNKPRPSGGKPQLPHDWDDKLHVWDVELPASWDVEPHAWATELTVTLIRLFRGILVFARGEKLFIFDVSRAY